MNICISDLLQITIVVEPSNLEDLLDKLAGLPHAIAVELKHGEWRTEVQFPAYRAWLDDLHRAIAGFDGVRLLYTPTFEKVFAA